MKVSNLISLFPVIGNPVITRIFTCLFGFFLSLTGRNEITLFILIEKSFFKNIFNRFFYLTSISLIFVKASVFLMILIVIYIDVK